MVVDEQKKRSATKYFRCPVCGLNVLRNQKEAHMDRHDQPQTIRRYMEQGLPIPKKPIELD